MSKIVKYMLILFAALALIFFSIKIENLEEHKAANSKENFDATIYAQKFWEEKIPQTGENAVAVSEFINLLETTPDEAFSKYGHVLGIAKTHYFMLKGEGIIETVEEEFLTVKTTQNDFIQIATDFIFGNAVRDGSGLVSINEFLNMTDFNNVSVAINKLVKANVVSKIKGKAKPGQSVEFIGACEINEEKIDVRNIRIIPVSVKISNGEIN